jgi:hypothetical protein
LPTSGTEQNNEKRNKIIKKIHETLFQESNEIVYAPFYYLINNRQKIPEDQQKLLKESLSKQLFVEEIEKRSLNTCLDGCPSCLHTPCDIDGDPKRNKLLLSRKLLAAVFEYLSERYSVVVEDQTPQVIISEIQEKLAENYQAYLSYTPQHALAVAGIMSKLTSSSFVIENRRYTPFINSSKTALKSLKNGEVVYQLCLRCREVKI